MEDIVALEDVYFYLFFLFGRNRRRFVFVCGKCMKMVEKLKREKVGL